MVTVMRARTSAVLGALAFSAALQVVSADTRQNPYGPIIERNAFGLKPPPPPAADGPKEEQKPPPNVKLTGISNLFQKRAFLEITEQATPGAKPQPGQPPGPSGPTVHRPILIESEAAYGVEVLSIDIERNLVRIRNNGTESELTFEAPKPSGTGAPGGAPHLGMQQQPPPGINPTSAQGQQPTVISSGSANSQATTSGGVTLFGGGTTAVAGNNAGVTSYGGAATVPSPLGTDNNLRSIPSRTIRTPGAPNPDQPSDPAQQAILMEAQRLRQQQLEKYRGQSQPPLPPTSQPPQFQNGGNPQPVQ
jgi:hypothetical protein